MSTPTTLVGTPDEDPTPAERSTATLALDLANNVAALVATSQALNRAVAGVAVSARNLSQQLDALERERQALEATPQ